MSVDTTETKNRVVSGVIFIVALAILLASVFVNGTAHTITLSVAIFFTLAGLVLDLFGKNWFK